VTATPIEREKFLIELNEHYNAQNLYSRLADLSNIPTTEWTKESTEEYNKCDQQHIIGMLAAEKKTCRTKMTAWSPKYSKAVENKAFWKIALSLKRNHTRPNDKFNKWAENLGILDIAKITITMIKQNLRQAQASLQEIKRQAVALREEHLRQLIDIQVESGNDKEHERRLQILLRSHKQQDHYRKIQQVLQNKEKTGLSYVIIPEDLQPQEFPYDPDTVNKWTMIHEPDLLQKYITQRNIKHFGQAHGSPFTIPPLTEINWTATSLSAEEIINGQVPAHLSHIDKYVDAILTNLAERTSLPEIDTHMTSDDVARGFRRWKEISRRDDDNSSLSSICG
jgi:hypothetical protein